MRSHRYNPSNSGRAALPEGRGSRLAAALGQPLLEKEADRLGPRRLRQIARLLAQSGGRLTDSLEREIMQKVFRVPPQ